jgi:hypothetical protein
MPVPFREIALPQVSHPTQKAQGSVIDDASILLSGIFNLHQIVGAVTHV